MGLFPEDRPPSVSGSVSSSLPSIKTKLFKYSRDLSKLSRSQDNGSGSAGNSGGGGSGNKVAATTTTTNMQQLSTSWEFIR